MEEKKIAFAKGVKNEIALQPFTNEEMKYVLSGFIRNGGAFSLGHTPSLRVHTEIACVAKLIYNALKEVYQVKPSITYERVARFGRNLVYVVSVVDEKLYEIMEDLEIFTDGGFTRLLPKEGLKRKNLKALVIGCFLANGSVNNPSSQKTSYFLEMAFTDQGDALAIKRKLSSFKNELTMSFKYIKRREKHVIYLKKSDQISVFLNYIGATDSMLQYENARVDKDETNTANRINICDAANYSKTLDTSKRDIEAIQTVLKYRSLALFDKKAQVVIKTRLAFNDYNYREIAEYVSQKEGIAITKSGVVHIMTAIREEAKKLKEDETK